MNGIHKFFCFMDIFMHTCRLQNDIQSYNIVRHYEFEDEMTESENHNANNPMDSCEMG